MAAASEAWIIDAVRSPRGVGKKDKGALSGVHPQKILGQVLKECPGALGVALMGSDGIPIAPSASASYWTSSTCPMPAARCRITCLAACSNGSLSAARSWRSLRSS